MDAIEKRARELLAAEYELSGYGGSAEGIRSGDDCAHDLEDASIRAIIAALTPPEGYILAPVGPTYEMVKALADTAGCNLAQAALAYRDALAVCPEVPMTVMPKRLSWDSAPEWANWLVNWNDGSQEFRKHYPWPYECQPKRIVARPNEQKGCQRCGNCRRLDFNKCKNRRD